MDSSVLPEPLCTLLKSALGASASVLLEPLCTLEKSAFLSPPPGASDRESGSLGFLGLLIGASCAASAVGRVPRRLLRKYRPAPNPEFHVTYHSPHTDEPLEVPRNNTQGFIFGSPVLRSSTSPARPLGHP